MIGDQGPEEFGLIMPFVVCRSLGGPYDDESFVAGARMQAVDQRCERQQPVIESWEPTPLVPQLDLIVMRHGYSLTSEPWDEHPDEWSRVVLIRTGE